MEQDKSKNKLLATGVGLVFLSGLAGGAGGVVIDNITTPNEPSGNVTYVVAGQQKENRKHEDVKNLKQEIEEYGYPKTVSGTGTDLEILKNILNVSEVSGLILNPNIGIPICDETTRGMVWFSKSNDTNEDQLLLCARGIGGSLKWLVVPLL